MLNMAHPKIDQNANEGDLLLRILHAARPLKGKLCIKWVKGHQDNGNEALSTEANLNIRADGLADMVLTSSTALKIVPIWGP